MFEWIATNWEGIAICCFFLSTVTSEIMAFTKNPSNGIVQAIVNVLKKLGGRD